MYCIAPHRLLHPLDITGGWQWSPIVPSSTSIQLFPAVPYRSRWLSTITGRHSSASTTPALTGHYLPSFIVLHLPSRTIDYSSSKATPDKATLSHITHVTTDFANFIVNIFYLCSTFVSIKSSPVCGEP